MLTLSMKNANRGFTLVEMLVTLAVSGIIMTGVYTAFKAQQDSYLAQDQIAEVQQNIRASINYMARDLRMAGFDPQVSGNFSIIDVRSRDLNNALPSATSDPVYPAISFTVDLNEDGNLDANETTSYSLYEYPVGSSTDRDGIVDLSLTQGGSGRQLLGESIIAMGLAYSYADDGGDVVTDTAGNVVWAIDSDSDNDLDLNIDTNADGVIDINDNVAGIALPTASLPDPANVDIANIVAVRIWLLAQTRVKDRNFHETKTFVVANQRITPNDQYRHRLVEMTVKCRNMGL